MRLFRKSQEYKRFKKIVESYSPGVNVINNIKHQTEIIKKINAAGERGKISTKEKKELVTVLLARAGIKMP